MAAAVEEQRYVKKEGEHVIFLDRSIYRGNSVGHTEIFNLRSKQPSGSRIYSLKKPGFFFNYKNPVITYKINAKGEVKPNLPRGARAQEKKNQRHFEGAEELHLEWVENREDWKLVGRRYP